MNDLIYTVRHSGTHSIIEKFGHQIMQKHTDTDLNPEEWGTIYTTYREPHLVGATWANRYKCILDQHKRSDLRTLWFNSWKHWADVAPRAVILTMEDLGDIRLNTSPDTLGLHAAHKRGDMQYFYHFVPKYFLDFAEMCVRYVRG